MADKILSIGLGANTSGLKKDMDNAAAIVKNAGQQMGDAVVQSSDKMSSSSKRAGENLQSAYRAAAREAREAAIQFGETSDRFRVAAQTAGQLKDRLDLTNQTIKVFSSDAPVLNATVGVMSSMAGAFSAAQGAAALFGSEGKALQETMVKLQGAMALSQGLKSLTEIGDAFGVMQTTITTKVIPSLMTMKGALIGSGIGIAVIAIGFLVNAYNEQKKATELAAEAQKKQNENLETYSRILQGVTKSVSEHNKELRLQVAAKEAGVSVDEMKAINVGNSIAQKEKKLAELTALYEKQKVELQNSAGTANVGEQVYSKDLEVLQRQINALKELQKELKESAKLQDKSQELQNLKRDNKANEEEHKRHLEEIRKMNFEMRMRGGMSEGIYLIQPKKASGISNVSNNDELRKGIIKNLEAAKLNIPQTVTFTFVAKGLNDIEKAGQRMVVLNDGVKMLGETLKGMIVPALQNFGNSLGKALGGDDVDGGKMLKQMLADVCNSMAMTMYAMAAGYYAIQAYGHAAAATAAGIGLNIAAGVLGAGGASGGVSSGSGGGGGGSINAGTFGNGGMNSNFGVLQVGGEIRGNNLLVSVNRSGYERGRVR